MLTDELVVGFGLLRLHLSHIRGTLPAHLLKQPCLFEQQLCLLHFLSGHFHQSVVIGHIGIGLQHIEGCLALTLKKCRLSHQFAGLGSLERMQTAEPVEDRQRGRQLITIIKSAHIGIAVGLRIDGTSKVILGTDIGIDRRQESSDGSCPFGLIVVEFQLSLPHLVVMFHRITHTLL